MTNYLSADERRLSPTEQTIWSADSICSMNFLMHVELRGLLTEKCLRDALLHAQRRHPLLRMHVADEKTQMWFRSNGVGPIPVRIVDGQPQCLSAEAEVEINTAFDAQTGPFVRCVWIRHSADHATLLVTFHHLIGDGISGAFLVRDILRSLAGETLPVLPLAESLDNHLPAMTRGVRGFLGILRFAGWLVYQYTRKGLPKTVPVEQEATFEGRRARVELMRFEGSFLEALVAKCRAEGTSMHGALSAAIVLACLPEFDDGMNPHVVFFSPVNMRVKFSPPIGDDIGFYVSNAFSSHVVPANQAFWALARDMKQGLTDGIERGQPYFGLSSLAPRLVRLYRRKGGGPRGHAAVALALGRRIPKVLVLSNIGRLDIAAQYGQFRATTLGFMASLSVLGTNAFTAATVQDTLCVNFIVMEPLISQRTQLRISERLREILRTAIY